MRMERSKMNVYTTCLKCQGSTCGGNEYYSEDCEHCKNGTCVPVVETIDETNLIIHGTKEELN